MWQDQRVCELTVVSWRTQWGLFIQIPLDFWGQGHYFPLGIVGALSQEGLWPASEEDQKILAHALSLILPAWYAMEPQVGSMSWTPSLKKTDGNRIGRLRMNGTLVWLFTCNYDDVGELQYELVPSALGEDHEPSTRVSRCWRRKSVGPKRCSPLLSAVKTSLCVCHNVHCMRDGKARLYTPTFRV